jgi:predicted DsbA family dithiol-disulfide isomerase
MKIDIVSDVACPWCIIGLRGLEEALARTGDVVAPSIQFHPFELNPDMGPQGQNIVEHMAEKYGSGPDQVAASQDAIKDKAAALGFTMAMTPQSRAWNTFDAHRLLHWAGTQGRQHDLKRALFEAYFSANANISDADVLVAACETVGLDGAEARAVVESGRFADYVRKEEQFWQERGIQAVPAFIIDGKYLVSGAQDPATFEQVVRKIAEQPARAG